MGIDLSKLAPAPWRGLSGMVIGGHVVATVDCEFYVMGPSAAPPCSAQVHIDFIALARNAFDVVMRRGWSAKRLIDGRWVAMTWAVDPHECHAVILDSNGIEEWDVAARPDPFTALVEADAWYKANVEKQS